MKRICLFGPKFFGYLDSIGDDLRGRGFDVIKYYDVNPDSFLERVLLRTRFRGILESSINRRHQSYWREISEFRCDTCILINPEAVPISLLSLMIREGVSVYAYFWDSMDGKPALRNYFEFLPRENVVTFDYLDSKVHHLKYLPLFYNEQFKFEDSSILGEASQSRYEESPDVRVVGFIGTAHSDRVSLVYNLLSRNDKLELSDHSFFFCQHPLLWPFNVIRNLRYYLSLGFLPKVRPISKDEIWERTSEFDYILDLERANQSGLTSRTLETFASGKKMITTNSTLDNHREFFADDQVIIVDRDSMQIDQSSLSSKTYFPPTPALRKQSLSGWVTQLLELFNDQPL